MARSIGRITGTGTGGDFRSSAPYDKFKRVNVQQLKEDVDCFLGALLQRNVFLGGSNVTAINAESNGDKDLIDFVPWIVDNAGDQITDFADANGAALIVQVRYLIRVSNAAINFTPKVWYGTSIGTLSTVATISGQLACAATSTAFTGTNQYQTVTLTLPTGSKIFKMGGTVAGTPATGYGVHARAWGDVYVSLP